MKPFSPSLTPFRKVKKGVCQTEPVQGSDYPFRGLDHVSFAKNHVSFEPDKVIFLQIYDGGARRSDHAYLGLFGRPIRSLDGL